jgi:hypothetical protein
LEKQQIAKQLIEIRLYNENYDPALNIYIDEMVNIILFESDENISKIPGRYFDYLFNLYSFSENTYRAIRNCLASFAVMFASFDHSKKYAKNLFCLVCGKFAELQCSCSSGVYYCSENCKTIDFGVHKKYCEAFSTDEMQQKLQLQQRREYEISIALDYAAGLVACAVFGKDDPQAQTFAEDLRSFIYLDVHHLGDKYKLIL